VVDDPNIYTPATSEVNFRPVIEIDGNFQKILKYINNIIIKSNIFLHVVKYVFSSGPTNLCYFMMEQSVFKKKNNHLSTAV